MLLLIGEHPPPGGRHYGPEHEASDFLDREALLGEAGLLLSPTSDILV
jgi:hypothetical protein